VAANLSVALAHAGNRVLQVGCDPKRDSTRLLLNGRAAPPVLDYIRNVPETERCLEDILMIGSCGVACIEAGGPEPGVGCAGRGILSTFELLETLGIRKIPFDVIIYDVLGDVVCGGFAVPLRKGYADAVLLVTSGEYMSVYAANNILRGIANTSDARPRVVGLVHNGRGLSDEIVQVASFAGATGLPVVASIPRDQRFAEAEKAGCTILETFPDSALAGIFSDLAGYMMRIGTGSVSLFPAQPLSDDALGQRVLGRAAEIHPPNGYNPVISTLPPPKSTRIDECRKSDVRSGSPGTKPPLRGCAFTGAIKNLVQMEGALTVAHAPRSCTHIVSHFLTSSMLRKQIGKSEGIGKNPALPLFLSTDMDEDSAIFGGRERLEQALVSAAEQGWNVIFVVTSCTPGIIGDDTDLAARTVMSRFPKLKIFCLPTGGNLSGDFFAGSMVACRIAADIIDPAISPEEGWVNIVGEISIVSNSERNFHVIETILQRLGLWVNCRFLTRTTLDQVRSFKKGSLSLLANRNADTLQIRDDLIRKFGAEFFADPFPVGFHETARWTGALARWCGQEAKANQLIEEERLLYDREIARERERMQGRRVIIVTDRGHIGWVFDIIGDLGMEITRVCCMQTISRAGLEEIFRRNLPFRESCSVESVSGEIAASRPDLVLSTILLADTGEVCHDAIPIHPDIGFKSSIALARRWNRITGIPAVEGWRRGGGCTN